MTKDSLLLIHENNHELISIANFLTSEGYNIVLSETEKNLNQKIENYSPDLILLPVQLNSITGIEICKNLKTRSLTSDIFIILFSNKKEEMAQIVALDSGADDYLIRPIHNRVLLSRIRALLKRKRWSDIDLFDKDLVIDRERYLIKKQGVEYYLPKKEFEILSLLHSKPDKTFTRDEIKKALWENFEKVRGRTVDVHIRKIREKIGDNLIATVKGVGYRIYLA